MDESIFRNSHLHIFNNPRVVTEGWYWALQSRELKAGKAKAVRLSGKDLAVFRTESGKVVAIDAYCPHRGAHLAGGIVEGEGIRCYNHRWKFDSSGTCVDVPCLKIPPNTKNITYPAVDHYGLIWIWVGSGKPHALPLVPDLAAEEVDVAFAKPYVKQCHPTIVMSDAIDVQRFRAVHRIPGSILNLVGEKVNAYTLHYTNVAPGPLHTKIGKVLSVFYKTQLTYSLCYWGGSSGSITVGPDFQHFYIIYANRLGDNGVSEGQVILLTRRRKSMVGKAYGKLLLVVSRIIAAYFSGGDSPQLDTIHFDFKTPIKDDKTILQFMSHVESLPVADWGFSRKRDSHVELASVSVFHKREAVV